MTTTVADKKILPIVPHASTHLPQCCLDLELPIQHLLSPEIFLDADGLAFMRAHGLLDPDFRRRGRLKFRYGQIDYEMTCLQLLYPDTYLDAAGIAFFREHGLADMVRRNTTVRVLHRCQHLTDAGRCDMYADRPKACRDFDCQARFDCVACTLTPEA